MIWTILLKKEFLVAALGVAATIFGMLNMPGLQSFFSSPDVLDAISTLVATLGGATALGGAAAAVVAEKPPELK